MKTIELTASAYKQMFPRPAVVYNSVEFNQLNASRASRVIRLAAINNNDRPIAGLTVGVRGDQCRAPFSAPFTMLDTNRKHRPSVIIEAVAAMANALPNLTITLPPPIYDASLVNQTMLALISAGARIDYTDWNYHLNLGTPYIDQLTAASRSTLKQAATQGFKLERAAPRQAYDIILANHIHRNHPMRMSFEQIIATTSPGAPVKADFFVLTNGCTDVAAAMVYHTSPGIAQVIYWGDVPSSSCRNPMNLLASQLFDHYSKQGFSTLDIGPASSNGVPDIGLCDFKTSIGCICTPKTTLTLRHTLLNNK